MTWKQKVEWEYPQWIEDLVRLGPKYCDYFEEVIKMSWDQTVETKQFEQPDINGVPFARCYRIIDLGTSKNMYGNVTHRVMLSFELPGQLLEDGRPKVLSAFYNLSYHPDAKWRQHLESWRGRSFDEGETFNIEDLVGKPALLMMAEKEGRVKITGITRPPQGMEEHPPVNDNFIFRLDQFSIEKFNTLSPKLQATIKESNEYRAMDKPEEDIPF